MWLSYGKYVRLICGILRIAIQAKVEYTVACTAWPLTLTSTVQQGYWVGQYSKSDKLLHIFRERFGNQFEFAQRTDEFGICLFSGGASSVDRGVVAVLRPNNSFGDVVIIAVALGPPCIEV